MKTQTANNRFLFWVLLISLCFIGQAILSNRLDRWVHPETFVSQGLRFDKSVSSTLRAVGCISGYKVLVGHAFWLKLIQYYGDAENSLTRYAKVYDYCSISSDMNPQFVSTYTLGAAILAFHVKRIDEAERLLQKGILSNPQENSLKLMLAAIFYQNSDQFERAIPFLEAQVRRGDAPTMLSNILANSYEKVGRLQDAINLWQHILKDSDSDEQRINAAQKLQKLYDDLKSQKAIQQTTVPPPKAPSAPKKIKQPKN